MSSNQSTLYDISYLREVSRNDETFILKMIKIFVTQIPLQLKELKDCFELKDYQLVAQAAHKIKPAIDNMGITSLKKVIREIETIAITNIDLSTLQQLIETMENRLSIVLSQLKSNFIFDENI